MSIDQYVGLIGGAVGVTGMLNSLRKTRIDDRTSAVEGLQVLVEQLQAQLDATTKRTKERESELEATIVRVHGELQASRADCQQQISVMQTKLAEQAETISRQAIQITQLDRRRRSEGQAT